ncbi:MAG: SUMF1/EgtB/PvdO family nonheme iron enzyme, partial [Planctomycetes bacterium]|nr:SUMF1/EgtB/PvdO family nonheme iron enzyme [Planctomycetota bacterium]
WEFACRAGSTTEYPFGDDPANLADYAWFDHSDVFGPDRVGNRRPNAWGLFDMLGNVTEWCSDTRESCCGCDQDEVGRAVRDSRSWRKRATRGGSWFTFPAASCRSASRFIADDTGRSRQVGIRAAAVYPSDDD